MTSLAYATSSFRYLCLWGGSPILRVHISAQKPKHHAVIHIAVPRLKDTHGYADKGYLKHINAYANYCRTSTKGKLQPAGGNVVQWCGIVWCCGWLSGAGGFAWLVRYSVTLHYISFQFKDTLQEIFSVLQIKDIRGSMMWRCSIQLS